MNHLFHRHNWCHVINTIIQLYMIMGFGIKLKSMSVRSWRWTLLRLPWNPCIAARVILKRATELCSYVCYNRSMHMAPYVFQLFFCQSFVDSVAFWCHPSTCCEDKGIEWRLLDVNHFLVGVRSVTITDNAHSLQVFWKKTFHSFFAKTLNIFSRSII